MHDEIGAPSPSHGTTPMNVWIETPYLLGHLLVKKDNKRSYQAWKPR
jgi:hypothetical protein